MKHDSTCTTRGDNLANAKNVDLNSIRVMFKYPERDGDRSDEIRAQPFVPTCRKCTERKTRSPVVVSDNDR